MAIHAGNKGQLVRPAPQSAQVSRFPAPLMGMDSRATLSRESLDHCVYSYNLLPTEQDMRVRKGYREWQTGLILDPQVFAGVHTIIPFDGIEEQGGQDRLFAVTNEGIWDVTQPAAQPTLKLGFTIITEASGYGPYAHYVDNDESDVLFYADQLNGLFAYDYLTDTWAQATGIIGPVVDNIKYVTLHKQRLWLIEENSTSAWYLPIGSKQGDATQFFFGAKFRRGGYLEGIFSWSIDGGAGVDDIFVAVSSSGDVVVYQGDDPSSVETWSIKGTYFIGSLPVGPNFGTEQGGELFLLSSHGLVSMNSLLQGVDSEGLNPASAAAKIAGILRRRMGKDRTRYGWSIEAIPSEGGLIISTPIDTDNRPIQYYYNISLRAWALARDLPAECFSSWKGKVTFGDAAGRVLYMDTQADNIKIAPTPGEINATPIEFSMLTSFTAFGQEGVFKRVSQIRPDFVAIVAPAYFVQARYDYRLSEALNPVTGKPTFVSVWDDGLWDSAIWGEGEVGEAFNSAYGGWGIGRHIAVATKGYTYNTTRLIGWDVIYTTGGPNL